MVALELVAAALAAIVGTYLLLELVTYWMDEEGRRFRRRRLKKAAKSKRKRPHTNRRSLDKQG